MKKTFLILSLALVSCKKSTEFPVDKIYVVDLNNSVCVEYPIIDKKRVKVGDGTELPLAVEGPCNRLVGLEKSDFKKLQNWARDQINDSEKKQIQLEK